MNLYVVFSSRTEGIKLLQILKKNRIASQLKSIPNEIKRSCGVSIVVDSKFSSTIRSIITNERLRTITGFYLNSIVNNRNVFRKI